MVSYCSYGRAMLSHVTVAVIHGFYLITHPCQPSPLACCSHHPILNCSIPVALPPPPARFHHLCTMPSAGTAMTLTNDELCLPRRHRHLNSVKCHAPCAGGLRHFANYGSWYVSSNNLCKKVGKKWGHLLGNTTSLPSIAFPDGAAGEPWRGWRVGLKSSTSRRWD